MKYVMLKAKIGGVERKVPIIFPDTIVHREVALAFQSVFKRHGWSEPTVHSAGEIDFGPVNVYGRSETLDVGHDLDDIKTIERYDYFHGI